MAVTQSRPRSAGPVGWVVAALAGAVLSSGVARADGAGVLEVRYTPVPRAQVAIWIEDASGKFLATVALTEAVAFRGIGNRPGASQMNSGYRWPYGRREGVLPIWAHRRASAPGAKLFPRVIFQSRIEGYASQTTQDQSKDSYYCLQFDSAKSTRDELDAVSCATQFSSDKGRYMTEADEEIGYGEPWELRDPSGVMVGEHREMPLGSVYPPRMDVTRCSMPGTCYDHADVSRFADDARAVMPEIDAVTRATAPGDTLQKVLFTLPAGWPKGDYVVWLEINVEGDYNNAEGTPEQKATGWNPMTYPSPTSTNGWDSWARTFGYPYRGQPSLAFKVPFRLGSAGEVTTYADLPSGRSSWEHWAPDYGKLEPITFTASDAGHMDDQNGSGADRLRRDQAGHRVAVATKVVEEFDDPTTGPAPTEPQEPEPGEMGEPGEEAPAEPMPDPEEPAEETPSEPSEPVAEGPDGVVIPDTGGGGDGPIGAIEGLRLRQHSDELRAHTWVLLQFRAARSERPLHAYEVRVATEPIVDETSFVRLGRPAKNATDDAEGATALMLPVDVAEGELIRAEVGDLVAETRYFVAVRATDDLNRHGPISVAEISTPRRTFATVSPCFIATAAYGTPLAADIDVLRHVRDRYLSATAPGRALVAAYERFGPRAARVIERSDALRSLVRGVLAPIVAVLRLIG